MLNTKLAKYFFISALILFFAGCSTSTDDNTGTNEPAATNYDTIYFTIDMPNNSKYEGEFSYADLEKDIDFNFLREVITPYDSGEFVVNFTLNEPLTLPTPEDNILAAKALLEASGYKVIEAGASGEEEAPVEEAPVEEAPPVQEQQQDNNGEKNDGGLVKKTGQSVSYIDYDDGFYTRGLNHDYTVSNNVVKDNVTGLSWTNSNEYGDVQKALSTCKELTNGGLEWRVPTVNEAVSLVHYENVIPTIDDELDTALLNGSTGAQAWTSAIRLDETEFSYFVDFKTGKIASDTNTHFKTILCVSGDSTYTKADLVNHGGYVEDKNSKLMWEDSTYNTITRRWDDAVEYCENLTLAGKSDWVLPNVNEMTTLLDYSNSRYTVSGFKYLPRSTSIGLWTSTAYPVSPDEHVYKVMGYNGISDNVSRLTVSTTSTDINGNEQTVISGTKLYSRCVRTVQ